MADYAQMSKAELLEAAAERDIAGRSSMTKDELVAALEASGDADAGADAAPGVFDGVDETEAARVDDAQSSHVDVPYPDGMPGPHPARSAPANPNARMSTLGEE